MQCIVQSDAVEVASSHHDIPKTTENHHAITTFFEYNTVISYFLMLQVGVNIIVLTNLYRCTDEDYAWSGLEDADS